MIRLLLLLFLVGLPAVTDAAIAEVASQRLTTTASAFASTTSAYPNNITSGNLLIVAGTIWPTASNGVAVTGCSTTFTVLAGAQDDVGNFPFIAYGIAGSTGPCTLTIDPVNDGSYGAWAIDEFSGVDATPLDVDGGNSLGTSAAPADALTTTTANALLIGTVTHANLSDIAITATGSYTSFGEQETVTADPYTPFNAVFRLATTATSYTVDWTIGASVSWSVYTAGFEAAAGGAAVLKLRPLLGVGQ